VLWSAFTAIHLWLGLVNLTSPTLPMGDVTWVYRSWMEHALFSDFWVGIDTHWVYPVLALLPMVAATTFGFEFYGSTWLTLVLLLNAGAFGMLTGFGRTARNQRVAWWWLAFLLLLGPIALARIDAVTVPFAIVAVLWLATRPALAGVLLAVAAWIKVWPAALGLAAVIALRSRSTVLAGAVATSALIVLGAVLYGAGMNVFSFITTQADRGLQIEAPAASGWLWHARATGASRVYYDTGILTFQVQGPGVEVAASIVTPLLALLVFGIAGLGWRAARRGADGAALFPVLSVALVTALIAVNKVGSPQFVCWLAVPVIAGLLATPRAFRFPALLVAVLAGLTQLVYPFFYNLVLALDPRMLGVLTLRNLLYFVLLGWAVRALWRLGARPAGDPDGLRSRVPEPALTAE
jgi:hypothetical protein